MQKKNQSFEKRTISMPENKQLIQSLQTSWKKEKAGARTYQELAAKERDEKQKAILLKLADA